MHKKTEKADMPEHRGCHNLFFKVSIPIKMSTFFGNSEHPFPEK